VLDERSDWLDIPLGTEIAEDYQASLSTKASGDVFTSGTYAVPCSFEIFVWGFSPPPFCASRTPSARSAPRVLDNYLTTFSWFLTAS